MLFIVVPCYATVVQVGGGEIDSYIGGFRIIPITKTDTNDGEANETIKETDTEVWAPASGKSIVLMGVAFTQATATTLIIESGTSGLIGPTVECTASGLITIGSGFPIWQGAVDETLTYTTNTGGRHGILMYGYEE